MNMGWTVIKIDENGGEGRKLSTEFDIKEFDALDVTQFRLLKYMDPYGDLTLNQRQMNDLTADLRQLVRMGRVKHEAANELFQIIEKCKREAHSYLKLLGD